MRKFECEPYLFLGSVGTVSIKYRHYIYAAILKTVPCSGSAYPSIYSILFSEPIHMM
jgi:hypothetical protein